MRRLLIFFLCLLPWSGMAQTSDKDFLTALLEDTLSDAGRQVVIEGFQGALSTKASLDKMTIADDQGIWLTVHDVTLDWSQSELLSGKLIVQEFSAGEIILDRLPGGNSGVNPEAGSFKVPDLPISIDIRTIEARHIVLGPTVVGQGIEGSLQASVLLDGKEGKATLDLLRTDDGPEGRFHLSAAYVRASGVLTLALDAVEGPGGIAVTNLGVPGKPAAELSVKGQGPAEDFTAELRLTNDGVTRLAGTVTTRQTDTGPAFRADLSGDLTPIFLPEYAEFFGPELRLTAEGQRRPDGGLDLRQASLTTAALSLSGRLSTGPDGVPELIDLKGQLGLDGKPVTLPLAGQDITQVASASLYLSYDRSLGEVWQTRAEILGLTQSGVTIRALTLAGQGRIVPTDQGGLFDGDFDFSAQGLTLSDAELAQILGEEVSGKAHVGWRSGGALLISDLALRGNGFDLSSTGTLGDLAEGLRLDGRLTGHIADLSLWSGLLGQNLRGSADLDLSGNTTFLTGAADITGQIRGQGLGLGVAALDGLMAGESLLDLSAKRDETGIALRRLSLALTGMQADLAGSITSDRLDLNGTIAITDLAVLGDHFAGTLAGDLAVKGNPGAPRLELTAMGKDLALGQSVLDRLMAGKSQLELEVLSTAGALQVTGASLTLEKGSVSAQGNLTEGFADLVGKVELADLSALQIGLAGALTGDWHYGGPLAGGRLDLQSRIDGLQTGAFAVDRLLTGENLLALQLDMTPDGGKVHRLDLSSARMELSAQGMLGTEVQDLEVRHRIGDLAVLLPGLSGALDSTGRVRRDATGVSVDVLSRGPAQLTARTQGQFTPDLKQADLTIKGTAQAGLVNGYAAPRSLSGAVTFDLRLKGAPELAALSGPIELRGGRLADPAQVFGLKDMAARLNLAAGRAAVSGTAKVTSGGTLTMDGAIGLTAPYLADLNLALNQMRLRDPELYTTTLQGKLTLKGPAAGGAILAGVLEMGRTELRIPSSNFSADGGLPGLLHKSEPLPSRATRERAGLGGPIGGARGGIGAGGGYGLNLQINAPNQVFIRGRGLDAELGGRLIVTGRTDQIVPAGAFNLIRGRLEILGRRLNLSEALLQLQGRIQPYIRIAASVESEGVLAEVQIEGPVDDPEVRFVSFPDLPQEEVLARLLFDRGLESLTAFQAIQLAGAVASLAGKGGEGVISNLRRKAGVDNLDVQTNVDGQTDVTIGKYLSDKAYTEVTVGQSGSSNVSINLDLAPHVTLKGSVDSEGQSGIGLFLQRDY